MATAGGDDDDLKSATAAAAAAKPVVISTEPWETRVMKQFAADSATRAAWKLERNGGDYDAHGTVEKVLSLDSLHRIIPLLTPAIHLTSISLVYCILTDAPVITLARALATNRSVTSLSLAHNDLHSAGVVSLANDYLAHSTTLTELDLFDNTAGPAGGVALARVLSQTNRTLTRLKLSANELGVEGTKQFVDALLGGTANRKKVEALKSTAAAATATSAGAASTSPAQSPANSPPQSPRGLNGDSKSAPAGAGGVSSQLSLTNLDLSENKLGSKGCKYIARLLDSHRTHTASLTALHLLSNGIGPDGITQYLGPALARDPPLLRLALMANPLTDSGLVALFQTLTPPPAPVAAGDAKTAAAAAAVATRVHNRHLTTLALAMAGGTELWEAALLNLLESNRRIAHVSIGGNKITRPKEIVALTERNLRSQTIEVMHWMGAALVIAFVRAQPTNELRFSVLPHLPALFQSGLTEYQLACEEHTNNRCVRNDSHWHRFTKTKFVGNSAAAAAAGTAAGPVAASVVSG